jgi:hypothetical protein
MDRKEVDLANRPSVDSSPNSGSTESCKPNDSSKMSGVWKSAKAWLLCQQELAENVSKENIHWEAGTKVGSPDAGGLS